MAKPRSLSSRTSSPVCTCTFYQRSIQLFNKLDSCCQPASQLTYKNSAMAIVSKCCAGEPEIGERHLDNGKWRVVVGWNHTNDTPEGLRQGRLWAWVSGTQEKFQVFDQDFNRSPHAGEIRDCGVANFTMIRMFHKYWAHSGTAPRDGNSEDKARCRALYFALIRRHRLRQGLPVGEDPEQYTRRILAERKRLRDKRKARAQLRREQKQVAKDKAVARRQELQDSLPGELEIVAGGKVDDPMFVEQEDYEGDIKSCKKVAGRAEGSLDNPIEIG